MFRMFKNVTYLIMPKHNITIISIIIENNKKEKINTIKIGSFEMRISAMTFESFRNLNMTWRNNVGLFET